MQKNYVFSVAVGILKGYDQLLNLVLDGTVEYLQGTWDNGVIFIYVRTVEPPSTSMIMTLLCRKN